MYKIIQVYRVSQFYSYLVLSENGSLQKFSSSEIIADD